MKTASKSLQQPLSGKEEIMQKILLKRTLRDLKTNLFRHMTLFLLITLAMFIVVATIASAQSLITTVNQKAEADHLEDGQFGTLFPLRDGDKAKIVRMGITLQPCFYLDFQMGDNSTLRLMKNRKEINLIQLYHGRLAAAEDEIVIERIYADAHQLSTGDTVTLAGSKYKITGIATSPDYEHCLQTMSDMSSDGGIFGTAFVTPRAYDDLLDSGDALHSEEYRYSYRLEPGSDETALKHYLKNTRLNSLKSSPNLTDFVKAADNPRIKAASNDIEININIGILAGIIVLALLAYVISVFVVHSIDGESAMIGTLYALGVRRRHLVLHYTMLPVALCLVGGALGTALGYSSLGISMMAGESLAYYSTPAIETTYSPYLLLYGVALPPLTAFMVNWLIIRKRLCRSALSLLRRKQPARKINQIRLQKLQFVPAFQIRQFLREKRSCFAVLAGMFVSLLILILGLNCYALCHNVRIQNAQDTKFAYMYQYKYPAETVPSGGYSAYIKGLKKEVLGYNMEVSFIGIEKDNPYFPPIKSSRKNEISISTSVANKYGFSAGDKVQFTDAIEEKEYHFVVKEIVPYSVGLCCFMDGDSMRDLFIQKSGYYNVVYADHKLDVDTDRLYSITTKKDVEKSSEIFMDIMMPLITMLSTVSILIFLIVLYQMMKVMIDRSSTSISLMKVFGYRDQEVRKLYLDGNFLLSAASALVMVPLAKMLLDTVYPTFIANVACGIDLAWPSMLYVMVYAGILAGYLFVRRILMEKLKKMTPAEVLKNRE